MLTTSPSLLKRVRQPGDRAGWERFIQLYTPVLYSWATRAGVRDPSDLVQDVFTTLVEQMPHFCYDPGRGHFRQWLKTILMNKLRKAARRPVPAPLADVPARSDPALEFDDAEYRRHLMARALHLMQTDFQPATWKSFWECEVNGRPAAEVAGELGLTAGAVWVNKSRVLARLRQELTGLWE
jgi:RNA polymerase sigma-70 factor (ECF subfamily)